MRETVHIQPVAIVYTRIHGVPMGRLHRPLAAWIGDTELWPHLAGLLRGGGIDVELHFGEPIAFSAGNEPQGGGQTGGKPGSCDDAGSASRSAPEPVIAQTAKSTVFCRRKPLEAAIWN